MRPRWTEKRLAAAIQAVTAMLAGEEGEGDAEGLTFDDLEGALARLQHEQERLRAKRQIAKPSEAA